jgi:DNA-binding XRE family transcriptional regulator
MRGAQLVNARESLGLFRTDLAKILNVDETTVYRWERNRQRTIRQEPLQSELCNVVVKIAESPRALAFGAQLKQAIKFGSVYTLFVLLNIARTEFEGCLGGENDTI